MKLYYSPGACSLATHIALRESNQEFELEKVDLGTKTTESGSDYTKINVKGSVPALELDNGEVLTEAAVTMQYVADQKPDAGLAPKAGTMERYRLMEALNFISTEMHKSFGALFNPNLTSDQREQQLEQVAKRCDIVTHLLGDNDFLVGNSFSVADAYLFTVLGWSHPLNVDMSNWPSLTVYMERIAKRGAVQEAMKSEGLGV